MPTLRDDLEQILSILYKTIELPGIQRDYDREFGRISEIIYRYGIKEDPKNLRTVFTLCMQEFFELIPQEQWKLDDPSFVKQAEQYAIKKFKDWIITQIT